ncbi:Hypothetical_protein [Hexamita inflata]|uniref:Hypothetical_protein n=1 Tax=Hexamita inflata TaxID=28002 RepID=A0AA86TNI3_9EUKA|nr:Hypothetical protein HINF_LOCUS10410 [Hexamita inflata]
MKKILLTNTSKQPRAKQLSLPPVQKRLTANISEISQSNSTISQLTLSSRTTLDTYRTSTSNSNVNKVLVNLQDRPSQIIQATQLGNIWSNQNRINGSSEDLSFDMEKLRQIQLNGSAAIFDQDFDAEFQIISESDDE